MAVLTINHYNDAIDSFVKNVADSSKSYYVFVGKPDAWPDDQNPPAANTSVNSFDQATYDDIVYGKKLNQYNVAYMIPKYLWTSNTVYDRYDQNDKDLYTKKFYVVTDKKEVYKCINNNYESPSTVKPDLPLPYNAFDTADGYTWKYMYTINTNYNTNFTTTDYMPIAANSSGGTYDVNVRGNTVGGTIDAIIVDFANPGSNYQTYNSGYLTSYVNNYVVQISNTASPLTDFYKDSSIYLKSGFGAGQLRKIVSYDGLKRQVIVDSPFNAFQYFELSNINNINNIVKGQTITQSSDSISYNYRVGYFNVGDTLIQTDNINNSNTFASGLIIAANSTVLKVVRSTANSFVLNAPIFPSSSSGVLKTGTVTISNNSNSVIGVGTNFLDVANTANSQYKVGDYINVGGNANSNIRRVTSIASNTSLQVDVPFINSLSANVHYNIPIAANPTSIQTLNANGIVSDTNLNGVKLTISNLTFVGINFFVGETATMVDVANVSQLSNGTVSYSNSTTVILSNVQGPSFQTGFYLLGSSSLQKANIDFVTSNPNITISNPRGNFVTGQQLIVRETANVENQIANATLVSQYVIPNELTEYIISPTVSIDGDGNGAIAYSTVDTFSNSIGSVVVVNTGVGYTYANLTVIANSQYGSGANLQPVISPTFGHGHDPVEELGARHVGISLTFDNIVNESYKFPGYGEYRKIGIIEDPLFDDVTINLTSFDRAKLTVSNLLSNNFANGEIVVQPSTNAAGVVVVYDPVANANYLEIKNIQGSFASNNKYANNSAGNDNIVGLLSGTIANVNIFNTTYFTIGSNVQIVSEITSGGTGQISQIISNNQIKLTSVSGDFKINDVVYDAQTNAYANVVSIYVSNNTTDISSVFGNRFNQTARVTLSTSYGIFQDYEFVKQATSNASGMILTTEKELDIAFTPATSVFSFGQTITDDNTGATGIVTFANTSYIKMTGVEGTFNVGDTVNNGIYTASITNKYNVLLLSNIDGSKFQTGSYVITGQTTQATGISQIANTISYPDLVRNSGKVTYIDNVVPFEKSNTSKEKVSLIIKF